MLVLKHRYLLFLLTAFIFITDICSAQISISIPDTIIDRGKTYFIPVNITNLSGQVNFLQFEFRYDAQVINIKSIHGGSNYLIQSQDVSFTTSFKNLDTAIINFSSTLNNSSYNTLCILEVEALAYSDSIAHIIPDYSVINTQTIKNPPYTGGKIKINGLIYLPNLPDFLGLCYPDPFSGIAHFDFSLEKKTNLKFMIFDVIGRVALDSDNPRDYITAYNEDKTAKFTQFNVQFDRGNYTLEFTPSQMEFPSGAYFMYMKTDNGIYYTNFIIEK